jgi:hypothetical protein
MVQYFPSITVAEYDWVRNPYAVSAKPTNNLPLRPHTSAKIWWTIISYILDVGEGGVFRNSSGIS